MPNNNNTRCHSKLGAHFLSQDALHTTKEAETLDACMDETHASVLLIKTTTQNRLDKAKQVLIYFIQLLKHFAVFFFFFQTLVDVFEKKHDKDHLEDMLTEVRRRIAGRVSGVACQVSANHTTLRYKVFL